MKPTSISKIALAMMMAGAESAERKSLAHTSPQMPRRHTKTQYKAKIRARRAKDSRRRK